MLPSFTIEMWVKWDGGPTQDQYIISKSKLDNYANSFDIFISKSPTYIEELNARVMTGAGTMVMRTDNVLRDRRWHHLALVNDQNASTQQTKFFVDGSLKGSASHLPGIIYDSGSLNIGYYEVGLNEGKSPQNSFFGEIDEIRVKNVALYTTNFTIPSELYNKDEKTVLLLHLDNNTQDSSDYNHNGSFIGNPSFVDSSIPSGYIDATPTLNPLASPTKDPAYISPTAFIPPTYGPTPTYYLISPTPPIKYPTPTPYVKPTFYLTPTVAPISTFDRLGVFRKTNSFFLRNSLTEGVADIIFSYGLSGDKPVMGDWDGNGTDTVGVFRNGAFYLRNSNTSGTSNLAFLFGSRNDISIAGDWNGDGKDTVGVFRQGTFYLKNTNTSGKADMTFSFGVKGDIPLAGDWNGDGVDTIGVYRPSTSAFYLKNSNAPGNPDIVFTYGLKADIPVVGDWNGDKIDTIAMYRNAVYYIRNSNSTGTAEITIPYGITGDTPLAGKWKN